jgi:hypothetical protein
VLTLGTIRRLAVRGGKVKLFKALSIFAALAWGLLPYTAHATIAVGASSTGFNAVGGATAVTTGVTTSATGSSFYVAAYYASAGGLTSLTDTFSNTYTAITAEIANTSDGGFFKVYDCVNCAGGASHVVTAHLSPTQVISMIFVEVTGAATSSNLDTQNAIYGNAGSPFACPVTSTTQPDLLLGFVFSASPSTSESFTSPLLTNSVVQYNFTQSALNAGAALSIRKTTTGTFDAAISDSAGYSRALVALIAIKEAGGGPPAGAPTKNLPLLGVG